MGLPLLHFVFTKVFGATAPTGGLTDVDALETTLRENPTAGDLVPRAGGVRKCACRCRNAGVGEAAVL
jgi:hypothetical protein